MVELLIKQGASIDDTDVIGNDAISYAVKKGIVKFKKY